MRTIVWFRGKDLRLADHAPLAAAIAGGETIPLFVLDPHFFAPERARELPHRIQFLLDALRELEEAIAKRGSRLVVVRGRSVEVVPRLLRQWRAERIVAHRWVEPFGRARDRRIAEATGGRLELFEGETIVPPGTLRTGEGRPYAVFTAFARAHAAARRIPELLEAPRRLPPLPPEVRTPGVPIPTCAELGIPATDGILRGGERQARRRLDGFLAGPAASYDAGRDRMDLAGTSRLSADLKFGTISVARVWREVADALGDTPAGRSFLGELVWREFTHSTLQDRPGLLEEPFRPEWAGFPWRRSERAWRAWAGGTTGYPVVDAAARQLLAEGFVHNRARMIAASFLAKHLLLDFRRGEAHYMKYLTDGDWAQNDAGWQWSAGCGCDAQPWFRIFNPVLQGRKFDPAGDYVRRWLPELRDLPARAIHAPWEASARDLARAGVRLGKDYPEPIVDHAAARARFLALAREHLRRPPP